METSKITNHSELVSRITYFKSVRQFQEIELKTEFKKFTDSLNPFTIAKDSFMELIHDKDITAQAAKTGLNLGADFIISQIMGGKGIKGFLRSLLVKGVTSSVIGYNIPKIISYIKNKVFNSGQIETEVEESEEN